MNGGGNRIHPPVGVLIDRGQPVRFRFEGREYKGFAGDTIASALAASNDHAPVALVQIPQTQGLPEHVGRRCRRLGPGRR